MNNEITQLRSDLALLKLQFSESIKQVENRLNDLLEHEPIELSDSKFDSSSTNNSNLDTSVQNKSAPDQAALNKKFPNKESSNKSEALNSNLQDFNQHNKHEIDVQYPPEQPKFVVTNSPKVLHKKHASKKSHISKAPPQITPIKPSAIQLFLQSFVQTIFLILFEWSAPAIKVYKSYQEKGMLGIFILTITGIALVLAGFGYLMQLLIDQLGAGSKSLLMGFAALLVMAVGIGLKIKTRFSEFATAIVTLGILLSYCTVYFSGSVYDILPSVMVLILYFLIAIMCHAIATKLDTKVVSGLGIIGIATMPILSNTVQIEPLYYLLSLAFVAISSLTFAYKHNQNWLANVTLIFTLASVQWVIGVEEVQVSAWAVDLFYIIFFVYAMAMLLTNKEENEPSVAAPINTKATTIKSQTLLSVAKSSLLFIAALVGSTVFMFLQASELYSSNLSLCFSFNALLAAACAVIFYKIKHPVTPFIILLASLWAMLAIISAISDAYWGISWAIEGILLLYVGRKYLLNSVSNQAQVLLGLSIIYCWAIIAQYFPLPALQSIDGWMLSIAIVIIIAAWQRMISHDGVDLRIQNKCKPLLQLVEVVWLSVLIIACSYIWLGHWTGVITIALQVFILFRARYCKHLSIEIFSGVLVLVPAYYIFQGVLIADSLSFSAQPLFAKLSVISIFAQLWLWSAFYRKYYPTSSLESIAEATRIVFYLLVPICWIASATRRLEENVLLILWLSPAIALFFALNVKHTLIVKQAKALTVLASLVLMAAIGELSLINSLLALLGFMVFYGSSFLLNKKQANPIYQFIGSWAVIALGFALPNLAGSYTESLLFAFLTGSIYWVSCLALISKFEHLKRNHTVILIINGLLVMSGWLLTLSNPFYSIIPVLFLSIMIYQQRYFSTLSFITTFTKNNIHLLLHSVGVITYLFLLTSLEHYRADLLIAPALAVHGAIILFMKNRHLTTIRYSFALITFGIIKLAFFDAASALLWQKVILFMGIGVFILAASFWYQKLISKLKLSGIKNEISETNNTNELR